jgi:L-arabinonolactonase
MSKPEVALDGAITCGECPVWVPEEKALYFTDIPGRTMNWFAPETGEHKSWEMPEELCSFALREQGGFVAAMRSGFALLTLESGTVDYIARPETDKPNNRLNDGRCDRQGRFWAGSMHEPRNQFDGVLYRLGTDKSCTAVADNVMVSNGLAWSPDSTTMYWSDSRNSTVSAFDFDPQTGNATNRRVFFETSQEQGRPDGATVDSEGFYWSACYMGGRVLRIAPDGTLDREIAMPVRDITMVCFGGDDLDTLYITTSCEALSPAQKVESPLSGAVFVADPGVTGLPEPKYKG